MFSKLKTIKKFSNEQISLKELTNKVRYNEQKNLIDRIRSVKYKSNEYNTLKLKLECITPHGTFKSLRAKDLINYSGYLYYDIDGLEINEVSKVKNDLIKTGFVSFISNSVGNKGLSFLIKYDTIILGNDTFNVLYSYVRDILIKKGFNIDKSAGGLVRKMIISYDKDIYVNEKVSLPIDPVSFKLYKDSLSTSSIIKEEKERSTKGNDTFFKDIKLIDKKDLNVIEETPFDIKKDFDINEIDYYKIIIPKKIKDGDKHRVYIRIINALYYLNPNITLSEVYSYIFYMNLESENKMNDFYLRRFVYNISKSIQENGIRIKLRKKKIHINEKYDKNEKQIMGAKINAKIRQNQSIKLIIEAKEELMSKNEKITQKRVAELTGLGIATVKRNWNKELFDIEDIQLDINDKEIERDYKLNQLLEVEEDLFFETETEIIDYKGFKKVEIEKVSQEDKKLFISKVNALKDMNLEPSEDLFYDMNLWSKEKTWYLYHKWRKTNKYKYYDTKNSNQNA